MCKKCLLVGIVILLSVNVAIADPPFEHPKTGEPLVIDCLRGTPDAIDGDLSDWNLAAMTPAILDVEEQLNTGQASWDGPEDLSAEFYMLWDDVNVYIGVVVKDDVISTNKSGANIWNSDCVEVFFATVNRVAPHAEHYQYGFNAIEQSFNWCNMDTAGQSEVDYVKVASTETADGYICEASIEYGQMLSLDFSVGSVIGFHPCVDDTDAADREIQMTWTSNEAHAQDLGYGHLVLSDDRAIAKELSKDPSPEHGAVDVPLDATLSWTSGAYAVTHDVYMGTSFDDVNDATTPDSPGQSETTYDPGLLGYGQTCYWRVDEVNGAPDNTIFKGAVWNFTTELFAYPIQGVVATSSGPCDPLSGPEKTIDGSGLNDADEHSINAADTWLCIPEPGQTAWIQYEFNQVCKLHEMLVWNYNSQFELALGFGLKDVTVEYSQNGTDWMVLGDEVFAQATANASYTTNTTVAFNDVAARFVRLTANSGHGPMGRFGLSEVRFLAIPVQARQPQPVDGAAGLSVDAELTWRAGRDALSHEVSFGTDPEALVLADTVSTANYAPDALDLGTTYYWQITEIQEVETWAGGLWSFTTQEFLVVDDFESYNDEDNLIYETWLDGWVNDTGSTVGYLEAPFAETTIVNSGKQSMPLFYDNADFATSEADLELSQDWTTSGIQSLSLYFHGDPENSGGQLYVKVNDTKVAYDGDAADITLAAWQAWNIDLSAVGNVSNVSKLTIGIKGAGASGVVYIDDVRLYPFILYPDVTAAGDTVKGVPDDGDWPEAETPDLLINDDTATKFLHFKGATEPTGFQITPSAGATMVTGITFTTANDSAERDPVAFELYGSNTSIDGAYTLVADGDIVDFAGETAWPRFTKNTTPITFDNDVAYTHYQVLFPTVRDPGSANSMQIAEVELLGVMAP